MNTTMKKKQLNKDEEGFLIVEAMLLLIVFVVLSYYIFDFFSIIHKGIINQTHARTYLFETLQHRSDISKMRNELDDNGGKPADLSQDNYRFHAVQNEDYTKVRKLIASETVLRHADTAGDPDEGTTRVMLKTGYGICINARCAR